MPRQAFFGFAHPQTSANQLNALSSHDNTEHNGEKCERIVILVKKKPLQSHEKWGVLFCI